MNNKVFCYHIVFRNKKNDNDSFLQILGRLVSKNTYGYTPVAHNLFISEKDTIDDLEQRLEIIIKEIKYTGVIKRIKKYKPQQREGHLFSWHIVVEVYLKDPVTPEFSNIYRIGRVCRSIQGEKVLCFFDEYGFLYMIEKLFSTSYPQIINEGDAVLFSISWSKNTKTLEGSFQNIIYDTSSKNNQPQQQSQIEADDTIIEYSLINEFAPIKAIVESSVNYSKRTQDKSMEHFFYKKWGRSFSFYDGNQTCVHSSSYAEAVLLKYLISSHSSRINISSLQGFQQLYNRIIETINAIDIQTLLSSYSVLENESRIVNHYDETHVDVTPHLETEDPYLLSLFPMKTDSYIGDYKFGQELKTNCHNYQKEKIAIEKAKKTYSPRDHHSYLLYDTMHPIIEDIILESEINKYWPLRYFSDLVSKVPIEQLSDYVNKHNRQLSAHSNVKYCFVRISEMSKRAFRRIEFH